jgi:hypothetical protein
MLFSFRLQPILARHNETNFVVEYLLRIRTNIKRNWMVSSLLAMSTHEFGWNEKDIVFPRLFACDNTAQFDNIMKILMFSSLSYRQPPK